MPDDLLANAAWLGNLARSLVRDGATAEDIVQETWVAALRSAPREPGRLKPWLARVLANLAHRSYRTRERRARHEALAARTEAQLSAGETAARLEVQRLLFAALDELDEPFKTTVVLRYLDGLDAAEIARREGMPASTARWRLQEGLARLRRTLDRRAGGDRERWALALAPLVPRPELAQLAAGAAAGVSGVLLMSLAARGTWIAAACALAALGVYVWLDGERHGSAADAPHTVATELGASVEPSGAPPLAPLDEREGVASSARIPADTAPPAVVHASAIEGKIVDELRRPLAGVKLEVVSAAHAVDAPDAAPFESSPGADFRVTTTRDGAGSAATSGTDGRFRIELADADAAEVRGVLARSTGYTTRSEALHVEPGRTHELGELVLVRAATVRGRVLFAGGEPCAGARVHAVPVARLGELERVRRYGPDAEPGDAETRTNADGTFELTDAAPGVVRVCAGLGGFFWSASELLELASSRTVNGVELVLEPLDGRGHIGGRVLAPDGTPVAGALVAYGYRYAQGSSYSSVLSAQDGTFRVDLKQLVTHTLSAHDPLERWRDVAARATTPGADAVVLQFVESRACRVSARDPAGRPAGPVELTTLLLTSDGQRVNFGGERSVARADTAPPGEASFQIPLQRFVVWVDVRGFERAELGPFEPDTAPRELTCTLAPRPGVRGLVVADGRPVAGAHVALHALADGSYIARNGFLSRLEPSPADTAESAPDGRFTLDARFAGQYALVCDAPGFATSEITLGRIEPATGLADIRVALGHGGAIEGRVLVPPGEDPAGVIVAFDRHDARARTLRADKEGRFRLDGLTPGPWSVTRAEKELLAADDEQSYGEKPAGGIEYPVSCTVREGETTQFDLDLTHASPAEFLAHVTLDGQPAVGWKLVLVPEDSRHLGDEAFRGAIDGRGDARIELPRAGSCRLELSSSAESGAELVFRDTLALLAGPNAWTLAVERGRVTGRIAPARAAQWRHDLVLQLAECDVRIAITPDAEGRFTLPFVPAGTWALLTSAKNSFGDGGAAPPVVVQVKRGATAEVVLE